MGIILTFVVNAGLNFALGLVIAKFLGPGEFGRFAIATAIATVLSTVCFEWLRLATTRFYSEGSRVRDPGVRATLELGYAAVSVSLAALIAAAATTGLDLGLPTALLAAAAALGIAMGWFDYQAALARARFLERTYALIVIVKNLAAFALMVAGAYLVGDPVLVLLGACVSSLAAILLARTRLADAGAGVRLARRELALAFARYALPLIVANVAYQLMPLMNRAALAAAHGFAEAGLFSLAADIGVRLFATAGSALDILLFQIAVRKEESDGRAAAQRQVGRNAGLVVAALLPLAAGFWLVLPAFEALFVPTAYRGAFAHYMGVLIPALFAFGLIQYALHPVFQLERRTAPLAAAALAGLGLNAACLLVMADRLGPVGVAVAQLAGLAGAFAIILTLALRTGRLTLPWRDLAASLAATLVMAGAVWPLRGAEPPLVALAGSLAIGIAIYGTLACAWDIGGSRARMSGILARHLGASVR